MFLGIDEKYETLSIYECPNNEITFYLQGDANNLHGFEVDQYIYLLMKKLAF